MSKFEDAPETQERANQVLRMAYAAFAVMVAVGCLWILFFSGSGVESLETAARREGKQPLRLWGGVTGDQRAITVTQKVIDNQNKQFFLRHPEIVPGTTTRLRIPEGGSAGTLLMALAGGTAPDVIGFTITQAQTLMDQGFLEPLEKYIEEEKKKDPDFEERIYIPSKMRPAITRVNPETGNPERYGLIALYSVKALLYRTDLFREAGLDPKKPPRTWDELLDYGIRLTRPEKQVEGVSKRRGQIGLWMLRHTGFMQLAWQAGGDMVLKTKVCPRHHGEVSAVKEESLDQCPVCGADLSRVQTQWKIAWASDAGVQAMDFLKDLVWLPWIRVTTEDGEEKVYRFTYEQYDNRERVAFDDGRVFDLGDEEVFRRVQQGCMFVQDEGGAVRREIYRMFARGELAMIILPTNEEMLVNLEREGARFENIRMASLPIPEGGRPAAHLGGSLRGINSQASKAAKRAAWEYIKYMCSETAWRERTRIFVENGMAGMVRPKLLKEFGYDEFYDQIDESVIRLYDSLEEDARSMPWNEGWLACKTSILNLAVDTLTQPGGYRNDTREVLQKYQDAANASVMKIKDEAYYGRIRKIALVIFVVVVVAFAWAIWRIARSKAQSKTGGMSFEVAGAKTPGYVIRRVLIAWLFLAPALLSVIVWRYVPLGWGAGMAFYEYKLIDGFSSPFVGIDNFIDIFHQPLFYQVLLNTLYYVGLTLGLGFIVPIVLALLLDECPRGSLVFRIVFYLPAVMSPLVTLLLWQLLYDPTAHGLLNQLLIKIGLVDPKHPLLFLNSPKTAMLCIIIPGIWAHAGPGCIIYLAALKVVPEDLYEAVSVDGGGLWSKLRLVTFPALAPLVVINFIGAFIASWQAMQNIFVLTGGGPLNATRVIGIEIWYNAFVYLRFGYATSMAWILASLLVGFTVLQMRVFSKVEFKTAQGN